MGAVSDEGEKLNHCLTCEVFRSRVQILRTNREYVIGRMHDADLALPSSKVSRKHAKLAWSDARQAWLIEDLGSSNGTRLSGVKVTRPTALSDGDVIEIAPFDLRYRVFRGDLDRLLAEEDPERGETRKLATQPEDLPSISGKFAGMELIEICHFVSSSKKSGVLVVRTRAGTIRGHILFLDGAIAQGKDEEGAGLDAVKRLLRIQTGLFEFRYPVPESVVKRLAGSVINTEMVLLDVARELDHERAAPPPSRTRSADLVDEIRDPSAPPGEPDPAESGPDPAPGA